MPANRPGHTFTTIATKAVNHGDPCTEHGFPGIAHKSTQAPPMVPNAANALLAQRVSVGEQMVIIHTGLGEFDASLLPARAAVGDPIYIRSADNTLANTATAVTSGALNSGYEKFGRLAELDADDGRCGVNFNARSTF